MAGPQAGGGQTTPPNVFQQSSQALTQAMLGTNRSMTSSPQYVASNVAPVAQTAATGFQFAPVGSQGYRGTQGMSTGYNASQVGSTGYNAAQAMAQGYQPTDVSSTGYGAQNVTGQGFQAAGVGSQGFNAADVSSRGYQAERTGAAPVVGAERVQAGQIASTDLGQYTNPFESQVVQNTLGDIERPKTDEPEPDRSAGNCCRCIWWFSSRCNGSRD
jgi:hypothetical protein